MASNFVMAVLNTSEIRQVSLKKKREMRFTVNQGEGCLYFLVLFSSHRSRSWPIHETDLNWVTFYCVTPIIKKKHHNNAIYFSDLTRFN